MQVYGDFYKITIFSMGFLPICLVCIVLLALIQLIPNCFQKFRKVCRPGGSDLTGSGHTNPGDEF